MKLILNRLSEDQYGTHGILSAENGDMICYTLEEPWHENQKDISCIPDGRYSVIPHNSQKFPDCWQIVNVPQRTAILIHAGNTLADTKGCVLVGLKRVPQGVLQSKDALKKLKGIIKNVFEIVIINHHRSEKNVWDSEG